ncbi:MAG: hypothetical protein SCJ97_06660 [Bacillota bacterium]|nr:hypothetical protein [Bacillota bacterium]
MPGIIHLIFHLGCGFLISQKIFPGRVNLKQFSSGLLFGLLCAMWSPVPGAFIFGFSPAAHYLGWFLTGMLTFSVYLLYRNHRDNNLKEENYEANTELSIFEIGLILTFTIFFCAMLASHFNMAPDGSVYTRGNLYGDLPFHLAMITGLAEQGGFPPVYTIFAGAHLGYPFLTNLLSSSLYLLGFSLRWSVLITSFIFAFALFYWFFRLAREILMSGFSVVLSAFFFFINGGLGAFFLLARLWAGPGRIDALSGNLFMSPTNWVEQNLVWSNVVCDLLLPQRTTLAGWAVLFFALFLLYRAYKTGEKRYLLLSGIIGGLLPLVHTHSFLAFIVIGFCWFILALIRAADKKALFLRWLYLALPLIILALPQLLIWTFPQAGSPGFLRFIGGWNERGDLWPWFWIKNVGVIFILAVVALIRGRREKLYLYLPAVILFITAEFFAFQPWVWDNIKIFFIWYLLTVFIVADYLKIIYYIYRERPASAYIFGMVIFLVIFSGALSLLREVQLSPALLFSRDQVELADYVKDNLPEDSIYLTADNHNNALASLAGRTIFCGYDGWLWSQGIDYSERKGIVNTMFNNPEQFALLARENGIDYVLFGPDERNRYESTWMEIARQYPLVYESGDYLLCAVSLEAKELLLRQK